MRLEDLQKSPERIRKSVTKSVARRTEKLSSKQKFWLAFALLSLATTFLIANPFSRRAANSVEQYKEGDIARESIVSPADIYVTDAEATDERRKVAREAVRPIFTFESSRADEAVQSFRSAWEKLQRRNDSSNANSKTNANSKSEQSQSAWTGAGGEDLGKTFAARRFSQNELDAITRVLRENADGSIYGDQDRQFLQDELALSDRRKPNQRSTVRMPETSMTALSAAREKLKEDLREISSLSEREVEAFAAALAPLVQPSIVYDAAATEKARENVARDIQPVTIALKRTQRIAAQGDIVTPEILAQISAVRSYSSSNRQLNRFFGLLAIVSLLFWTAWKFIEHRGQTLARVFLSEEKTFALFGFVVLLQTVLMIVIFRLAEFTAVQNAAAPLNDATLWSYAAPFAMASLLITLLADRRTAIFTGFFMALITGLVAPKSLEFALFAVVASAVAVYGIGAYRSRQSVTTAGVLIGLASASVAVALLGYSQQPFILNTVLLAISCGLASGLVTAAFTAVFLPMGESLFGILTDVKLLELSNADLPALGQVAMRAPGTNQHSHAVGQLAEDACRTVGANALLARIGALYHDIGKTAAPDHYVENQLGRNPHDKLRPAQSAKIIISHVTYGIKLGKEMGLPQRIIDFIPQHHGTRTLHYFLKKAQAEAKDAGEVSENDFRYPGPKPQFKESAIMMIADSCEAAARSLSEPNPENIRFIVTKIIDAIMSDDQLDECDLTLRQLTQIRESMIKSLVAIYHSRVDYPGYVPPAKTTIPAELDSEERGMLYKNPAEIPISPGGEIEDEAVEYFPRSRKAEAKTAPNN